MRLRIPSLVVLASALAMTGSVSAQDQEGSAIAEMDPDLRCAVWSAGVLQLVGDTDVKTGVTAAFTYFAGRYEGSTGQPLERAMTAEVVAAAMAEFPALSQDCQPRMVELGNRLNGLSDKLEAARPEAPASDGGE